jgi:hypothetical protein
VKVLVVVPDWKLAATDDLSQPARLQIGASVRVPGDDTDSDVPPASSHAQSE